jgi:hypothetical protein
MTNAIMKWLVVICLLVIIAQPASARTYYIHVYKVNDGMNQNAFVKVWQGDSLIDKGYTDSEGVFPTDLIEGQYYHITASGDNRYGEFNGVPGNNNNIDIYTS